MVGAVVRVAWWCKLLGSGRIPGRAVVLLLQNFNVHHNPLALFGASEDARRG